jgi:hypothetical protein
MYGSYRAGSPGSPLVWICFLAAIPVAAGLSWLAAVSLDEWVYGVVALIGGMALALILFTGFISMLKRDVNAPGLRWWGRLGLAILVWAAWTFTGCHFLRTTIYVDNFSDQNVRLQVDGKPWLEVRAGELTTARLPRKALELTTIDAQTGKELDRRTVEVDSGPFIFNVLGAGLYEVDSQSYGMAIPRSDDDTSYLVRGVWIKAKVDYLFQDPPDAISVSQGTRFVIKSYLKRLGPASAQPKDQEAGPEAAP